METNTQETREDARPDVACSATLDRGGRDEQVDAALRLLLDLRTENKRMRDALEAIAAADTMRGRAWDARWPQWADLEGPNTQGDIARRTLRALAA